MKEDVSSSTQAFPDTDCAPIKMVINELHFITGNKSKLAEVQDIMGNIVPLKSLSLELVEIQGTIEEISKDKCRRAAEAVGIYEDLLLYNWTIPKYRGAGARASTNRRHMSML